MTDVGHLWAVGFDDMGRAAQVRDQLARLGATGCLVLLDTAVVVRYPDGSVTLDGQQFVPTSDRRGHSLARFLAGLALGAPPLTGAAVGTLARVCGVDPSCGLGIDENFICAAERLMRPGSSALFLLDRVDNSDALLQGIRGLGGTVLKTSVDLKRAREVQSALAAAAVGSREPREPRT